VRSVAAFVLNTVVSASQTLSMIIPDPILTT
jgi:hypothetical protein